MAFTTLPFIVAGGLLKWTRRRRVSLSCTSRLYSWCRAPLSVGRLACRFLFSLGCCSESSASWAVTGLSTSGMKESCLWSPYLSFHLQFITVYFYLVLCISTHYNHLPVKDTLRRRESNLFAQTWFWSSIIVGKIHLEIFLGRLKHLAVHHDSLQIRKRLQPQVLDSLSTFRFLQCLLWRSNTAIMIQCQK